MLFRQVLYPRPWLRLLLPRLTAARRSSSTRAGTSTCTWRSPSPERLRITHVLDTHDHADHVSGRVRLAQATGARSSPARSHEDGRRRHRRGRGRDRRRLGPPCGGGHARATGPSTWRSWSPTSAAALSRGCCSAATRCSSATSPAPISRSRPSEGAHALHASLRRLLGPRRPRRGVARAHRRVAVRRRRPERQVELHDRLRAPPQPAARARRGRASSRVSRRSCPRARPTSSGSSSSIAVPARPRRPTRAC